METQTLTAEEFTRLEQCWSFLTQLTDAHSHNCRCPLCVARAMCNVDDVESRTVRYAPHEK